VRLVDWALRAHSTIFIPGLLMLIKATGLVSTRGKKLEISKCGGNMVLQNMKRVLSKKG
jgi:hypothetical protein